MSLVSALSIWEWLILALIPPAVLMLYFLKLRRQPMEVPSTYLWRRTIEDLHVNSIWQKLRQNLLLYLQLLFLLAIILACLRPGFSGKSTVGKRWVFLIDNSASMQASDEVPSRLEVAKKKVRDQIASMGSNDVAMVLSFSDRADVRQGFTSDKRKLFTALQGVEPTNRTTDIGEALRASAGLANPGRSSFGGLKDVQVAEALPATLFLYSDGGFPPLEEFDLGNLTVEYVSIGRTMIDNVAILAFTAQRNDENGQVQAFGRIVNHGSEDRSLMASLYREKQLLDAANVTVDAGEEVGVNFDLSELPEGELRLELDVKDELSIDNVAYAALRPNRQLSIALVTPGNTALEASLQTGPLAKLASVSIYSPEQLKDADYQKREQSGIFDVVIYDQCVPEKLPVASTLFIGVKPPLADWKFDEPQSPVVLMEWDKRHPMVQYLELGNLRILEGFTMTPPESGSVLIRSDTGPVMAIAPRGAFQDAVLGFGLVNTKEGENEVNTDWAIKRSFPIFVYSAVEFLGGGVTTSAASTVLPGQAMAMSLSSRHDRFQIETPQGRKVKVDRAGQSQIVFTQTEQPGIYKVYAEDNTDPAEIFAVNLFSPRESNAATVENIALGGQEISKAQGQLFNRKEWWRFVLLIGLGVLVGEWIIYNRRVFV